MIREERCRLLREVEFIGPATSISPEDYLMRPEYSDYLHRMQQAGSSGGELFDMSVENIARDFLEDLSDDLYEEGRVNQDKGRPSRLIYGDELVEMADELSAYLADYDAGVDTPLDYVERLVGYARAQTGAVTTSAISGYVIPDPPGSGR
jgi:hypothetical protein